jgi:hypothetical protein
MASEGEAANEVRSKCVSWALVCTATLAFIACGAKKSAIYAIGSGGSLLQPSLSSALDPSGRLWLVAGYTDLSSSGSTMGLSVRSPTGEWQVYAPLTAGPAFRPSGDAWLATVQRGSRVYYVSLLEVQNGAPGADEIGDGLSLAVIDVESGSPEIEGPRRIDQSAFAGWDEPTVSATRPSGALFDTVLVAGTPIDPTFQDTVAVLVSHDGGRSFHYAPPLFAPGYPGRAPHRPDNTAVRPVLAQDPRPGQECHAYLAFGVYYATALRETPDLAAPSCIGEWDGCRSIAESETQDCGETWTAPSFIAIDTGTPVEPDFRGFGYAIANDGSRLVLFGDEDADNAPILLKRAAAGAPFTVTATVDGRRAWADGPVEVVTSGPGSSGSKVRRWRPTLSTSSSVAAIWVEEEESTRVSTVFFSLSPATAPSWSAPRPIELQPSGVVCESPFPEDDYMGVTPVGPSSFAVAWTGFLPCGSREPRHIVVGSFP